MTLVLDRTNDSLPRRPNVSAGRPWRGAVAIPSGIPGMLTRDEREYLAWVGANAPGGRVIELGCFLGCSTAALLAGLAERDRAARRVDPGAQVITHDSFVMPHGGGAHWAPGLREGDWFGDLFEANVAPYANAVPRTEGDPGPRRLLVRHGWLPEYATAAQSVELYPEQRPVDVVFVDLAKVWGVHNTVIDTFASFLPVGGVLVQQDFKSWLAWLFLHMWQLREQFEPVHDVPGGTVGFVRRSMPPSGERLGAGLWTGESFPRERFDEIWDGIEASWSGFGSGQTSVHAALARGRHAVMIGRHDHGVACFERAAAVRALLGARPEFEPWRGALDGIWTDALAMLLRGLAKAGAPVEVVERARRIA